MTLVKDGKADLIQDHEDRCKVIQWDFIVGLGGGKIGLSSEYSRGKWELTAKETGAGDQWMGNYSEETSRLRGVSAKQT